MKLNCRQGDLARVVRSVAGNRDKIVQCVRARGPAEVFWPGDKSTYEFMWEIDRWLPCIDGRTTNILPDSVLRPIRGLSGDDEMLRIAGRPNEVEAPRGLELPDGVEVLT